MKNKSEKAFKIDILDVFSILLWLSLLIPGVRLPFDASFNFPRTIFYLIWLAAFFIYVTYKIRLEKRIVFVSSASLGNRSVLFMGIAFILSFIFSLSKIDSLFGYNLSFSSSAIFLISLPLLYALLRMAGLSLEIQVSRILSALPFSLLLADIISILLFLLPVSFYNTVFGALGVHFTYLTLSPFALLGVLSQSSMVHILALAILFFQLGRTKIVKNISLNKKILRLVNVLVLTVSGSYLFFQTTEFHIRNIGIYIVLLIILFVVGFTQKNATVRKNYLLSLLVVVFIYLLLGLVWNKIGSLGQVVVNGLTPADMSFLIEESFLRNGFSLTNVLTGFGLGVFPYKYIQFRDFSMASKVGFLYEPSSMFVGIMFSQGLIGITAMLVSLFAVLKTFIKTGSRSIVSSEFALLAILFLLMLIMPTSLLIYVVLFVALASYFDKIDSMPKALQQIKAISIKESLYTNRSVNRTSDVLFRVSIAFAMLVVIALSIPLMTILGYVRASSRYSVAQVYQSKNDLDKAESSFADARQLAFRYKKYCTECAQLDYLAVSSSMSMNNLYASMTKEERDNSAKYQSNRLLSVMLANRLTTLNPQMADYWLLSSKILGEIALEGNNPLMTRLAITSVENAKGLDKYSITAYYTHIDLLMSLGNTPQINSEIGNSLRNLQSLVGYPLKVQILTGVLEARNNNFESSVNIFESIKKGVTESKSYSEEEKKSIIEIVNQNLENVKSLKEQYELAKEKAQLEKEIEVPQEETEENVAEETPSVTPTATPSVTEDAEEEN